MRIFRSLFAFIALAAFSVVSVPASAASITAIEFTNIKPEAAKHFQAFGVNAVANEQVAEANARTGPVFSYLRTDRSDLSVIRPSNLTATSPHTRC